MAGHFRSRRSQPTLPSPPPLAESGSDPGAAVAAASLPPSVEPNASSAVMPAALIISSGAIMSPAEICQLELNPLQARFKRLLPRRSGLASICPRRSRRSRRASICLRRSGLEAATAGRAAACSRARRPRRSGLPAATAGATSSALAAVTLAAAGGAAGAAVVTRRFPASGWVPAQFDASWEAQWPEEARSNHGLSSEEFSSGRVENGPCLSSESRFILLACA